jgi:hypothetical protein
LKNTFKKYIFQGVFPLLFLLLIFYILFFIIVRNKDKDYNTKLFTAGLIDLDYEIKFDNSTAGEILEGTPTIVKIGEETLKIYEYTDASSMKRESLSIDKDGYGTDRVKVSWISMPHFYKKGRIIVLYLGNNSKINTDLERLLGKQFAGGN